LLSLVLNHPSKLIFQERQERVLQTFFNGFN
jgi:hypothetical protein